MSAKAVSPCFIVWAQATVDTWHNGVLAMPHCIVIHWTVLSPWRYNPCRATEKEGGGKLPYKSARRHVERYGLVGSGVFLLLEDTKGYTCIAKKALESGTPNHIISRNYESLARY